MRKEAALERESRWAVPTAIATFVAVVLFFIALLVDSVSGDGSAEVLRSVDENGSSVILAGLLQAISFALLVFPLTYLFRAAAARSDRVRSQLIGLVIVLINQRSLKASANAKNCPGCGHFVSRRASACPQCGRGL